MFNSLWNGAKREGDQVIIKSLSDERSMQMQTEIARQRLYVHDSEASPALTEYIAIYNVEELCRFAAYAQIAVPEFHISSCRK